MNTQTGRRSLFTLCIALAVLIGGSSASPVTAQTPDGKYPVIVELMSVVPGKSDYTAQYVRRRITIDFANVAGSIMPDANKIRAENSSVLELAGNPSFIRIPLLNGKNVIVYPFDDYVSSWNLTAPGLPIERFKRALAEQRFVIDESDWPFSGFPWMGIPREDQSFISTATPKFLAFASGRGMRTVVNRNGGGQNGYPEPFQPWQLEYQFVGLSHTGYLYYFSSPVEPTKPLPNIAQLGACGKGPAAGCGPRIEQFNDAFLKALAAFGDDDFSPPLSQYDRFVAALSFQDADKRPVATATPRALPTTLPTPKPTLAPPSAQPALFDGADLASQSQYMTVNAGDNILPTIIVRNSGTTTWKAGEYGIKSEDEWSRTWQATRKLWRDVRPGEQIEFKDASPITAPSQPGTYRYGFTLTRPDGTPFGYYFFVQVDVRAPPTALPPVAVLATPRGTPVLVPTTVPNTASPVRTGSETVEMVQVNITYRVAQIGNGWDWLRSLFAGLNNSIVPAAPHRCKSALLSINQKSYAVPFPDAVAITPACNTFIVPNVVFSDGDTYVLDLTVEQPFSSTSRRFSGNLSRSWLARLFGRPYQIDVVIEE
jgi:hypothetical protein